MDTNGFLKRDKSRAFGRPCTRTRGLRIWRRIASAVLCAALLGTSIGGTLTAAVATDDTAAVATDDTAAVATDDTAAVATDDLPVTVENKGETNGSVRTDADTQTECSTPSGADT